MTSAKSIIRTKNSLAEGQYAPNKLFTKYKVKAKLNSSINEKDFIHIIEDSKVQSDRHDEYALAIENCDKEIHQLDEMYEQILHDYRVISTN